MKKTTDELMYSHWYIVHVKTNNEEKYLRCIQKYFGNEIPVRYFRKEVLHQNSRRQFKVYLPLFPGYLFVKDEIEVVFRLLKEQFPTDYIRPVMFNKKNMPVRIGEMRLLLKHADRNGNFRISRVFKTGDKFEVIDGPLKNMSGKILFVNEKKKKAKVQLSLFNQIMEVSLGLDIIEQKKKKVYW